MYVDKLVIAGTTLEAIRAFKKQITEKNESKDLGELNKILKRKATSTVEGGH